MSTPDLVTPYGVPMFVEAYIDLASGPSSWLVEGVIPRGGLALLYGAPKTGKSMLALDLALAVTQAHPSWLGFPIAAAGRVLYLQLDTPRSLWQDRIRRWEAAGVDFTPWGALAIEDKESAPYPFNILHPSHAGWLAQAVAVLTPTLVILDTWRECFRGDENDSDRAQSALSALSSACSPAAVVIVAHGKKPPADPAHQYGLMDEGRGSSYLPGAVDTVMRLRAPEGSDRGFLALQGRALELQHRELHRAEAGRWLWQLPHPPDPGAPPEAH